MYGSQRANYTESALAQSNASTDLPGAVVASHDMGVAAEPWKAFPRGMAGVPNLGAPGLAFIGDADLAGCSLDTCVRLVIILPVGCGAWVIRLAPYPNTK